MAGCGGWLGALLALTLALAAGPARATPADPLAAGIAELNRLMARYLSDPPPGVKIRAVHRNRRAALDPSGAWLQLESGHGVDTRIPIAPPWQLTIEPIPRQAGAFRVRLSIEGRRIRFSASARPPLRAVPYTAIDARSRADAERAVHLLGEIRRRALEKSGAQPQPDPKPRPQPKPKPDPKPRPQPKPQPGQDRPYRLQMSVQKGTHDGRSRTLGITIPAGAWLTAFVEGGEGMRQKVDVLGPDGRLARSAWVLDGSTGALRPGYAARLRAARSGRYQVRITPPKGSRGPFTFEGRVVQAVGEPKPETDLCDALDFLVVHVRDGLGHLADVTRPGVRAPVDFELPELGARGWTDLGRMWHGEVFVGPPARARRKADAAAAALTRCLGPGSAPEVGRLSSARRRRWVRDGVKLWLQELALRPVRGPAVRVELTVFQGEH